MLLTQGAEMTLFLDVRTTKRNRNNAILILKFLYNWNGQQYSFG